jgi:hypothetical protein
LNDTSYCDIITMCFGHHDTKSNFGRRDIVSWCSFYFTSIPVIHQ